MLRPLLLAVLILSPSAAFACNPEWMCDPAYSPSTPTDSWAEQERRSQQEYETQRLREDLARERALDAERRNNQIDPGSGLYVPRRSPH